ncbi:MAG: glutaredoxin 3 [Rhodospirillaceae bacterium]|jgi:glutaredoxin 3|nr:glutaredoxin 3 [Rhodospirillaceae bacterium]MBT3884663.1 glutaredoxin 3 [Rhodospirillaceae bacterium]MBT4115005.1 glutaredoxin 3 [Rhodospirillaceae bacterium]MBT4671403.1 glutaredoxin 3 [Rhodospirillaceae bacterium]MBT4721455.1 glutaredoxin 3 [Rhodospirillaceae bacterium]
MAKIEIYTSPFCGFCWRAKSLLSDKGVEFSEIDITFHPGRRPEMMERSNGSHTVPQIFIDDAHIGGCDELLALDHKGGLDPLLQAG